jgi:hypothetical protein
VSKPQTSPPAGAAWMNQHKQLLAKLIERALEMNRACTILVPSKAEKQLVEQVIRRHAQTILADAKHIKVETDQAAASGPTLEH